MFSFECMIYLLCSSKPPLRLMMENKKKKIKKLSRANNVSKGRREPDEEKNSPTKKIKTST